MYLSLTAQSADVRGSLAVRFVDTRNRPVSGLTVVASSGAFGEIGWAKTDESGLALVNDAPDTQIVLRTSNGANCEIRPFTADPDRGRVDTVQLPRGDVVVGGRVTDPEDRPITGASVVVSTQEESEGRRRWCVREAITDANGVYTLRSVGAGKKTIRFKARAYESVTQSVSVSEASRSSTFSAQLRRSGESTAQTVMN